MTESPNHLDKLPQWSIASAQRIADQQQLELKDQHIDVLLVARDFYDTYGFSPSMRPLCKLTASKLGTEKGRSVYLNKLFPGSPAKIVALLAGLPKPKNCL